MAKIYTLKPTPARNSVNLTVDAWANDTANMSYSDRLQALIEIVENERMSDDLAGYFGGQNS